MESPNFVHLRMHSEYDIRKGVARLDGDHSAIARAAALQQPALALTDTGCMFGAVKFYNNCRRRGIKPIIGCELKVEDNSDGYMLLLCMSQQGYINLSRLLSRAYAGDGWLATQWRTAADTEGVIALSGGRRGMLAGAVLRGQQERALATARRWRELFPERLYLEVWRANDEDFPVTDAIAEIGKLTDLPVVATHPVQCTAEADKETLNIRMCIAGGRHIKDVAQELPLSDTPYLLSTEDMRQRFDDLPGAIDNSVEVAKRCNFMFDLGKTYLPSLPSLDDESAADTLTRCAREGLAKKLPADLPAERRAEYDERLAYETSTIIKMNYADYFLIVMDFIAWAKQRDIPVGPGRGSGAGSLVAYALDITTIDPIKFGLLFERFLNPERVSMPDFDVDFCVDGRDEVIHYVEKKYGADCVSQIVTFGTIGARGAIRDVGRVLGLVYPYCDRVARMVPNGLNVTLADALSDSDEFKEEAMSEEGGRLIELAQKVEGLPRNIGTHAGGVLISPKPLEEYCPRYVAADTQTLVSQLDMVDIEKIGLVKFDFLGLRTLTILAHAQRHLKESAVLPEDFSLADIPLDDPKVYRLYSAGDTIGIFQCESRGMRELMRQLLPDRFEDIIALMALYRPGPLNSGIVDDYIKRKHGKQEIRYPHPSMQAALDETYGVCVYQEQVMESARVLAGYSLGEADLLRRAMGKKKEDEMAAQRARFVDGAKDKLDNGAATKLFDEISAFAGYGFNKSHAAAYALLSYQTAYLKCYYPAAFLAAVLTAEAGDTERVRILVEQARRSGIEVDTPDVNGSFGDFRADGKGRIRYGLAAVKGVGRGAAGEIVAARQVKPFTDLFDFCARMTVNQTLTSGMVEALVFAGAFDLLHANRAAVKETLPLALSENQGGDGLFGTSSALVEATPWQKSDCLINEKKSLGFHFSGNFYQLHSDILQRLPLHPKRLADIHDGQNVLVAGLFLRTTTTQRMRNFGLVNIADDDGIEREVRVKSEELKAINALTAREDILIVAGKAESGQRDTPSIAPTMLLSLDEYFARRLRRLILICTAELSVAALREKLPATGGKGEIILRYQDARLSCDCSLGREWSLNLPAYRLLEALAGVTDLKLEFA